MSATTQNGARSDWTSPYPFESQVQLRGLRLTPTASGVTGVLVGGGPSLIFSNPGYAVVYVVYGGSTVQPSLSGLPIFPGPPWVISLPPGEVVTHVGAITDVGTGLILIHRGFGS